MDYQLIISGDVVKENTGGTCVGRVKAGPVSFARFSTDDISGSLIAYIGGGEFTDDAIETFGGYGVAQIPDLQGLMQFICKNGFEHHVAVNMSEVTGILEEAFVTYLGIDTYRHC